MRQDIRLFLGDRELEFNKVPQILFNYTETDLHNPTTIKNSWTKTIQVEGTPNNNDVFGHFWRLDRYQDYGGGQTSTDFNPLIKTDFTLYVGGALYEKGYCKLTNIEYSKGVYTYSLNLFGGMGQFLSRLTYQEDSDVKLTLADLNYNFVESGIENTLNSWRINKDEVYNAWASTCGYSGATASSRYNLIQYVPTYDGTPSSFDNEKVLINYNGLGLMADDYYRTNAVQDNVRYTTVSGYSLATFEGGLTPWTSFDIRSYLMRPAVRLKYIIDACGDPTINGGYQLDLDSHFFNSNNPYYWNSWVTLKSFSDLIVADDGFLSNALISKETILSGDKTPGDYLVSFAKLFGLYFFYDPTEDASNTTTYPNGVVHLMDRNTFFTDEVVNIDGLIDYSKKSTITPTVANSKWLSFNVEHIDSEVNSDYKEKWGYDYGRQSVNTNYNFDDKTTNLYDGSAFKSGVMVREKNPYYSYDGTSYGGDPNVEYKFPSFFTSGMKYELFNGENSMELQGPGIRKGGNYWINDYALPQYDSFPKLQCHTTDNSPSDGSGVLLFLNGAFNTIGTLELYNHSWIEYVFDYYITDDVDTMKQICDENPCYIFTLSEYDENNNRIARKINAVPNFTRDWIQGPQQEGNITLSWNFGHPQETFVPNVYSTTGDSIYDKTWGDYVRDMYSVNTKMYTAYVKFDNINVGMLRKYFYFSNAIWRLNKIKDYDCNNYDTTQCEFIKIQDVNNYKLDEITAGGGFRLTLNSYSIGYNGGTIAGTVYLQEGGRWDRGSNVHLEYSNGTTANTSSSSWISPSYGTGQTSNLTVTIPANPSAYTRNITIYLTYGGSQMSATISQATSADTPTLDFAPASKNAVVQPNAQTYVLYFVSDKVRPNTVSVSSNSTEWVDVASIDETTSAITLSVSANTNDGRREALITINGIGLNGAVVNNQTHFYQDGVGMDVYPSEINLDYNSTAGGRIDIITSTSWTATINDVQ